MLLEDRQRLAERLPRGLLLLRLPAHGAEAEQRTAALERVRLGVGSASAWSNASNASVELALRSGEQAAAACGSRHGPEAPQASAFSSYCSEYAAGRL